MKTKDRLAELPKKYPELFKSSVGEGYGRVDDDTGEVTFHFQCGDGWYEILDTVLHHIRHKLKRYKDVQDTLKTSFTDKGAPPPEWILTYFKEHKTDPMEHFAILQIKEKFGGLRFYWRLSDDNKLIWNYIDGVVSFAESMSYVTCEYCGLPGKREGVGWIITLCDECRKREHEARGKVP